MFMTHILPPCPLYTYTTPPIHPHTLRAHCLINTLTHTPVAPSLHNGGDFPARGEQCTGHVDPAGWGSSLFLLLSLRQTAVGTDTRQADRESRQEAERGQGKRRQWLWGCPGFQGDRGDGEGGVVGSRALAALRRESPRQEQLTERGFLCLRLSRLYRGRSQNGKLEPQNPGSMEVLPSNGQCRR